MKKVKLVKKALLPAVIAVCCSLLALTSVSYAWFTLGNTASVESIDVNVTGAEGLQISADASNWKSNLLLSDLDLGTNQFLEENDQIQPISSVGNVVDGKLQLFTGSFENDKLTVGKATELSGTKNFIAFDLYVQVDKITDLKLSATSSVTSTDDTNVESAVRVAFVNLGTEKESNDALGLGQGVGTENEPKKAKIWEPNSLLMANGQNRAAKESYKGVNGLYQDENDQDVPFALDAVDAPLSDVETFELGQDAVTLFEDLNDGITKIRVYIWLEGQDVDCVNNITDTDGVKFSVKLNFEIPE